MAPISSTVRVLSLDAATAGPHIGFAQIKIIRAIMTELWKKNYRTIPTEADIGAMKPSDYFDIIFGGGTGGIIAVYLGRLHLTIQECEDKYKQLGDEVYTRPFSPLNPFQRYNYDHTRLDRLLQEQTSDISGVPLAFAEKDKGCKAVVLTKRCHSAQSVHLIESFDINSGKAWEAIRATIASHSDFPCIKVGGELLFAPEAGASNPAEQAWNKTVQLFPPPKKRNIVYPPTRGICLISIGSGAQPPVTLHSKGVKDPQWSAKWWQYWAIKLCLIFIAICFGLAGQGRRLPQVQELTAVATGPEGVHAKLRKMFNNDTDFKLYFDWEKSGYFRFNFDLRPDSKNADDATESPPPITPTLSARLLCMLLYLAAPIWSLMNVWTRTETIARWNENRSLVERVAYDEYLAPFIDPKRASDLTSAADLLVRAPSETC